MDGVLYLTPTLPGNAEGFKKLTVKESYDTDDVDEDGKPKDLSYLFGMDTSGEFPTLKLVKSEVPAEDPGAYCVHFAWRSVFEKDDLSSQYHPFGN